MKKNIKVPKTSKGDHAYTTGKVATSLASAIVGYLIGTPGLNVIAAEVYTKVLKPPLAKRTEKFLLSISEGLIELETKVDNFNLQSLSEKPFFISIFMQSFQIALRSHKEEKLNALRNAVINTAKPMFPEDDIYLMFINWIDA
jgi:hypothetical protein